LDGLEATDDEPGLLWRTVPPDDLQGEVISLDMQARGVTTVAVIHEVGAYGEGLDQAFRGHFVGGPRTAQPFPYSTDGEMATAVADVASGGFEEVVFISSVTPTIADFLNAASGLPAYDSMGIFLTDGAYVEDMLDEARNAASHLFPNIRGTVPRFFTDSVLYDTFRASYRAAFDGEDPSGFGFTAHAYDAAWLAAYGVAWSSYREGGIFGTGIARGLRRVTGGEPVDIGPNSWTTVRARFEAGQRIDVTGASGRLDYDPVTEETTAPIIVWAVDPDGEHLLVLGCVDLEGLEAGCNPPAEWSR
jgi:branched-chain amino acid transport system substrate-binding protein